MKMRWVLFMAVLALVLASVLVACGGAKEEAALDGKALVEARCTTCHDLKRVTAAQKTSDEWKATVGRMVSLGAELNEVEQKAVIDYLAEAYPK